MSRITAALLALVFSQVASAATVTFDFTGTLSQLTTEDPVSGLLHQDFSVRGQAVSGSFTVRSEGLAHYAEDYGNAVFVELYQSPSTDPSVHFTGSISINGTPFDVAPYSESLGTINLRDWRTTSMFDQFGMIQVSSGSTFLAGPEIIEVVRERSLSLGWTDPDLRNDWFTLTGNETPNDVLMAPFGPSGSGYFNMNQYSCVQDECTPNFIVASYAFNIDSVTRTVAPVPLPGALLFLSSGCAALGLMRRRRSGVQNHAAAA